MSLNQVDNTCHLVVSMSKRLYVDGKLGNKIIEMSWLAYQSKIIVLIIICIYKITKDSHSYALC